MPMWSIVFHKQSLTLIIFPYQKLFGMKPIASHFQLSGSVCYVFVPKHLCSKFDWCIFVGYDLERKGWDTMIHPQIAYTFQGMWCLRSLLPSGLQIRYLFQIVKNLIMKFKNGSIWNFHMSMKLLHNNLSCQVEAWQVNQEH